MHYWRKTQYVRENLGGRVAASPCSNTFPTMNAFLAGVSLNRDLSRSLAFRLHSSWREQCSCPLAQAPLMASQRPWMTADQGQTPPWEHHLQQGQATQRQTPEAFHGPHDLSINASVRILF